MPILSNSKHERFAHGLAQGKTADEAYALAGYSPHRSNAARLSAKDSVRRRVEEILGEALDRAGVTIDRIVAELAKIGFSDIRKAIKWRGNVTVVGTDPDTDEPQLRAFNEVALVDSDKIDDDTAGAIASIAQTKDGALKLTMHDKRAALVDLGRHRGMFPTKVELGGPGGGPIQGVALVTTDPVEAAKAYQRLINGEPGA